MKTIRWRYVLFEVLNQSSIDEGELISLIWRQIYSLFGVFKGSKSGFKLIEFDKNEKKGIARISWNFIDEFRVVLSTINMQNEGIQINEILVAGTQASLQRKMNRERTWNYYREKAIVFLDKLEGESKEG